MIDASTSPPPPALITTSLLTTETALSLPLCNCEVKSPFGEPPPMINAATVTRSPVLYARTLWFMPADTLPKAVISIAAVNGSVKPTAAPFSLSSTTTV